MVVYDPRYMSWDAWCSLMAELFAGQQLGTMPENRWQDWASGLSSIGYFNSSGVPDHRGFDDWRTWAMALVGIVSIQQ